MTSVAAIAVVTLLLGLASAPVLIAWAVPKLTLPAIVVSAVVIVAALGSHLFWSWDYDLPAGAIASKAEKVAASPAELNQLTQMLQSIDIECERIVDVQPTETAGEVLITCVRKKDSEELIHYLIDVQKGTVRLP